MITLPKPETFWARPPKSGKGDFHAGPIFAQVGEALSAWELVETEFANMFGVLVEAETLAAVRAYGTLTSGYGRRDALNAASTVFFHKRAKLVDEPADYKLAIAHYSIASDRRNDIAHGTASYYTDDLEQNRTFLAPADYNNRRTDMLREEFAGTGAMYVDYRYTSADIAAFVGKFRSLKDEVLALNLRLLAVR